MLAYYLLCLEQEEEEEEQRRADPLDLSNEEFFSLYRTDQETFLHTCNILKKDLKPKTNGYSVELQVLSTLRLLGSGSFQDIIAEDDFLRMSQATVSRSLNKVVATLVNNMKEHIKFPITSQDQLTMKKGFYKKCGMPNVLGVVDCIHIEIPKENLAENAKYLNRKGTHSMNVLLACDDNGLITNVVARWPGAAEDSDVWKNSNLRSHLEESSYNGYFLGDNSFSCDPWLVTPYLEPKKDFEIAFNEKIQKAMAVIERVSRTLKTRFRCLQQLDKGNTLLGYRPEKVCRIVTACCILHNIWHKKNSEPSQDEATPDDLIQSQWPLIDLEDKDLTPSEQGFRLRDELAVSLHRTHNVRNVEVRERANSQLELASDLLNGNCNTMGSDVSSGADIEYRLVSAELENEEQALREQRSRLRDELAASLLVNDDMDFDVSSRDDEESQFQDEDVERTLREQNSKLRAELALKLSTDIEGESKLRDELAADFLDSDMNVHMPSRDDGKPQFQDEDVEQTLREQNSKLRAQLALKLSTDINNEELALREGGSKLRDEHAADFLDNDMNVHMPSRDDGESQFQDEDVEQTLREQNSKLRAELALKVSTGIDNEELAHREGGSKLRDELAADFLDNDMNVDMPSRDGGGSQLQGEDLDRTLREQGSKLRGELALKLSTDIDNEELALREGGSKLRDELAADFLDNDMLSTDDEESQFQDEDVERTLREQGSKLRDKLALKLSTDIDNEELALREGGSKLRDELAADFLDNDMLSTDDEESQFQDEDVERTLREQGSKLRDKLALKLSTDIDNEELALREGGSKLRDELAADFLDNDMLSTDDEESQFQDEDVERTLREQGSKLRDKLALKLSTDINNKELALREGGSKLKDELAADFLDNDMNVDMPSRDDRGSRFQGRFHVKRTLSEQGSKLREELDSKLCTILEKEKSRSRKRLKI